MKSKTLAGAVAGVAALCAAPSALAAPVTVDLRVEGPTRTLVERQVTVDVRAFKFSNESQTYPCDGTSANSGPSPTPVPTRNGALAQAQAEDGFEMTGEWFEGFGPAFERINGEAVGYDADTRKFLAEYQNGDFDQNLGGCARQAAQGDDLVFAYGTGSEPLLRLTGPATVKPGESATLTVTNQSNGQAVDAASVAGRTTSTDGRATTAPLTTRGPQSFKASKTGTIRSNRFTVCVTDGADGFCGSSVPGAPAAPPVVQVSDEVAAFGQIKTAREGQRFARGRGPRTLAGIVDADAAGLRDVRVRLSRTDGARCQRYDGARERLVTARRCGVKNARTFSVGDRSSFSYLLPSRLPRGRWVFDVIVIDRAGNQTTTYQRGRNRVVFFVG